MREHVRLYTLDAEPYASDSASDFVHHDVTVIEGRGDYLIYCRYWPAVDSRAFLIMVHGVVSYSGWLEPVAIAFQEAGISCLAMDRRGAESNQQSRGDAPDADTLIGDLDAIVK